MASLLHRCVVHRCTAFIGMHDEVEWARNDELPIQADTRASPARTPGFRRPVENEHDDVGGKEKTTKSGTPFPSTNYQAHQLPPVGRRYLQPAGVLSFPSSTLVCFSHKPIAGAALIMTQYGETPSLPYARDESSTSQVQSAYPAYPAETYEHQEAFVDEEDDFSADVDVGAALQYWTALRHMGGKGKQKEDSEEDKSEFGMRCLYASYLCMSGELMIKGSEQIALASQVKAKNRDSWSVHLLESWSRSPRHRQDQSMC